MSLTKDELTHLAKAIYIAKVGWLDPKYWDFQPIVQRAFDAAQAFSDVLDSISQQQTQTDQPPQTPQTPAVPVELDPIAQQAPAPDPTAQPDQTQSQSVQPPADPTAQPQPPPLPTT